MYIACVLLSLCYMVIIAWLFSINIILTNTLMLIKAIHIVTEIYLYRKLIVLKKLYTIYTSNFISYYVVIAVINCNVYNRNFMLNIFFEIISAKISSVFNRNVTILLWQFFQKKRSQPMTVRLNNVYYNSWLYFNYLSYLFE